MHLSFVDTKEEILALKRKSKHVAPHLHNALGDRMCDKWNTGAGSWTRVIPHGKGRYWFCIS